MNPVKTEIDGQYVWLLGGDYKHREDGPAVIDKNTGETEWWLYGFRHRDGGEPAVNWLDQKEWWVHGKLHRDGGPAIESIGQYKETEWFHHGIQHRVGGPAVSMADGREMWYYGGKLHRLDGPAYDCSNSVTEYTNSAWYIHGKRYTEKDFKIVVRTRNSSLEGTVDI